MPASRVTITLTRSGANQTTFSVSTTNTATANRFSTMYYATVNTTSECKVDADYSSLTFTFNIATFSATITGRECWRKYLCIAGTEGANYYYRASANPISYSGPTLTLSSAGADNAYATGDNIDVHKAAFGYNVTVTGSAAHRCWSIWQHYSPATRPTGNGQVHLPRHPTYQPRVPLHRGRGRQTDNDGVSISAQRAVAELRHPQQDSTATPTPSSPIRRWRQARTNLVNAGLRAVIRERPPFRTPPSPT